MWAIASLKHSCVLGVPWDVFQALIRLVNLSGYAARRTFFMLLNLGNSCSMVFTFGKIKYSKWTKWTPLSPKLNAYKKEASE